MDYQEFKAEDFIMDESFREYCVGVNEEAKDFWVDWIEKNPKKSSEIQKAKELYFLLNGGKISENFKKDQAIFNELLEEKGFVTEKKQQGKVASISFQNKWKWMAAAVILFVVFSGGYFLLNNNKKDTLLAQQNQPKKVDIEPGSNKAVLTLSNGQKIILDNKLNGTLANQGEVNIIKLNDGQLSYTPLGNTNEIFYNTVSTPRGGQYQLILSDGTKVWLNSASSLRFPTIFSGTKREVELEGEGYFEVASNTSKPFHVKTTTQQVEVLGTHFNVNSYLDEDAFKTTLLEGSVKVSISKDQSIKLQPGQQAETPKNTSQIIVNNKIDVTHVMAWKNGWFEFENTDLVTIMRQISRWYDVDVVYNEKPRNEKFGGRISKHIPLSKVLHLIESNGVKFKLEGKKLIVQP